MASILLIIPVSLLIICGVLPKINGRILRSTDFDDQACIVDPPVECIEEPEIYSKWKASPIQNISEMARFGHEEMVRMSCAQALEVYSNDERLIIEEGFIKWVAYQVTDRDFEKEKLKKVTHVRSTPEHKDCSRTNFGSSWNAWMEALDARGYKVEKDEKGHILASQLCGPIAWYNLAPQTPAVNRNIGRAGDYGWCNLENELKKFLRNNCGQVVIDVFLNYDDDEVRPKGFKVCAQ